MTFGLNSEPLNEALLMSLAEKGSPQEAVPLGYHPHLDPHRDPRQNASCCFGCSSLQQPKQQEKLLNRGNDTSCDISQLIVILIARNSKLATHFCLIVRNTFKRVDKVDKVGRQSRQSRQSRQTWVDKVDKFKNMGGQSRQI